MAELATLEGLIKERDHLEDILELIKSNEIEKAVKSSRAISSRSTRR